MGLFRVLCCCFSSSRYDDSISDYVPYARSITATPDPVRDLSKNTVKETTRPIAKDLTPPPNYSAASLPLKKQTIAEAEAVPIQELSSAGEIKQRPIKELHQRKDHTSICHDYTPRTPQAGSSRENNSSNQPRYELQSPFQSQTVSPITPPRTNPLVLSTGIHRELPNNPAFPSSPSTTSTISGDYPLNNAPFSPVSPPSTTTTTIPASSPPAAPAPTQTPITPPPIQPGLNCPSCFSRNDIRPTGAGFNAGRTFRICSNQACRSWNGFTDAIGLTPGRYCDCHTPAEMRLVAMNRQDAQGRRQAFYSCQYKACSVWERCVDADGEARWFSRGEMDRMRREGRI